MPAIAAFAYAALLVTDWFPNGLAPIDTGGVFARANTCAVCHAETHAQWQGSRHGVAWTNAIFVREYRDKPLDWCVHCHAPLPEQRDEIHAGGGALANEGVTCVACHVRQGRMQSRTRSASSPHDTVANASFGGPEFCGGCHQFNFPVVEREGRVEHVRRYTSQPMQDTQMQHARGSRALEECLNCHGASGHAFPGGHDKLFLTKALAVSTCLKGRELRVTMANVGAGHNVPTGDVHRHLVLRVWPVDAPERLQEVTLGRRFGADDSGTKRLLSDTSIPAGRTHTARFRWPPDASSLRLELRLVYTIDEFPFRGRDLTEPTWTTIVERDLAPSKIDRCGTSVTPGQARHPSPRL